ncbi:MAG: MBOAT family O-acyltransferase [Nitrospirota bacterium]
MLFNSFEFAVFFPLITLLYFLSPHKLRWMLLLGASCIFYMAFIPVYILILAVTIVIDYIAGIKIENAEKIQKKKLYLIVSIVSTCLVLFIFKYFNFFNNNFASIANFFHWNYPIEMVNIILPIGLSFHTFQSLSYVIEVYRGNQKAERHFGIYSLYVMFYPQLVAGPIERPQNLLHQFREEYFFEYQRAADGMKLMAWGLFKKVVIADRLAIVVNHVYSAPTEYAGLTLIVATIFFAFQIYCDFSGYSDIAIGAAQVMGFSLMDNFKRPYHAASISEFWKRWHISLSTWFRDYVYIPLGGNRVSKWKWQMNLFLTFLISGLWHGANWTYVLWGALNGFYLIFALWTQDLRNNLATRLRLTNYPVLRKGWAILVTFSLVCFAWIFFRARTLDDAWYMATHLLSGLGNLGDFSYVKESISDLGLSKEELFIAIASLCLLEFVHLIQRHANMRHLLSEKPVWYRWSVYYAIGLSMLFFGVFGKNQFIYFQF